MTSDATNVLLPSVENLIYQQQWDEVRKQLEIIQTTGADVMELLERLADNEEVPEDIINKLFAMRQQLNQQGGVAVSTTPKIPSTPSNIDEPVEKKGETTAPTYVLVNPFPPKKKRQEPPEVKKPNSRKRGRSGKPNKTTGSSSNKKPKRNNKKRQDYDDDEGDDGDFQDTGKDNGSVFLDQRVAKFFDSDLFYGTITGFCPKEKTADKIALWTVTYDDGDKEDYERHELQELRKAYSKHHEKHDPIFDQD